MDAGTFANLVIQILTPLTPYLGTVGTAIATKLGETAYEKGKEQAKHLYEAIRKRFAQEKDGSNATQALQTFVNGDLDFAPAVKTKLERLLQTDPAFADQLRQIINAGPLQSLFLEEEAKATHIRMSNTLGMGQQEINLGKRATAEDVEMNIKHE